LIALELSRSTAGCDDQCFDCRKEVKQPFREVKRPLFVAYFGCTDKRCPSSCFAS
jgi:hypothetical protein